MEMRGEKHTDHVTLTEKYQEAGAMTQTTPRRNADVLLPLCCLCACLLAFAPQRILAAAPSFPQESSARLASAAEGQAVVENALQFDQPVPGAQDCSHLVQRIYAAAGFDYPYASSFDLYAGNENFRRVKVPQPGDLIAWPGHVGIVLDPAEHSFYSLVRSGLKAENYYARYWRSRGKARFYRYIVDGSASVETAAGVSQQPSSSLPANKPSQAATKAAHRTTRDANAPLPLKAASERSIIMGPPAPAILPPPTDAPASILIEAEQRRPTQEEVADSISELSNAAGNVLRAEEPLKVRVPVIIFERFTVERVQIKNDHGWAYLQMESNASLTEDGADFKRRHEKVRWELRRTESGWIALAPSERAYVPRDVAVRILAAQLARLTESEAASKHDDAVLGQEARIANLLSALLQPK